MNVPIIKIYPLNTKHLYNIYTLVEITDIRPETGRIAQLTDLLIAGQLIVQQYICCTQRI